MRAFASSLVVVVGIAACTTPALVTAPATVELLGPAPAPGLALQQELRNGRDEFVLFDTSFAVHAVVMHRLLMWERAERMREPTLAWLLESLAASSWLASHAPCGDVAIVARALLDPERPRSELTAAQQEEIAAVEAARVDVLRFHPKRPTAHWCLVQPSARHHAVAKFVHEGLPRLVVATGYLQRYLAAWEPELRRAWCVAAAEALRGDEQRLENWRELAEACSVLAGCEPMAPAVPGESADEGSPNTLPAAFADLHRALVASGPSDPAFAAMLPAQWRAKWSDTAAFLATYGDSPGTYGTFPGRFLTGTTVRVVVEPLPLVWQALRRMEVALGACASSSDSGPLTSDLAMQALALQEAGRELPTELEEQLRGRLVFASGMDLVHEVAHRGSADATAAIRCQSHLVRVPIHWRGATRRALALRLWIEHEVAPGQWQGPTWGVDLAGAR